MGININDPDKVWMVKNTIKNTIEEISAITSNYDDDPYGAEASLGNDCAYLKDLLEDLKNTLNIVEGKD